MTTREERDALQTEYDQQQAAMQAEADQLVATINRANERLQAILGPGNIALAKLEGRLEQMNIELARNAEPPKE